MERLIHYSDKPLVSVASRPHLDHAGGAFKTTGLWVSVDDDWLRWCKAEDFALDKFTHATEVILKPNANIKRLSNAAQIKEFTRKFKIRDDLAAYRLDGYIDWPAIRKQYDGLIIAPYCWSSRLDPETLWYYGWDCASGVIWNADCIATLKPTTAPKLETT